MGDYIEAIFNTLIANQGPYLSEYPDEQKAQFDRRSAELWVDWPPVRVYALWFTREKGFQWKPAEIPTRNPIYMKESIFAQILARTLDIGEALNHRDIMIQGEHSLYDFLELRRILETLQNRFDQPTVDKAIESFKNASEEVQHG